MSYWLGNFSSQPPASSITDFFEQQIHGGDAACVFADSSVTVLEFVPDAPCPQVIVVPCFDAAANACHLGFAEVGCKFF